MKVYEVLADAIEEVGFNHTYTIPGTHIYHLNHSLTQRKIKNIVFRHEMGTTIAADAYGRLTGKPGLAIDTAGPGILNGLTGLGQAFAEASPLIYITGETRMDEYFGFHGVDLPLSTAKSSIPISKATYIPRTTDNISQTFRRIYNLSISGRRGPVHLALPYDILQGNVDIDVEPVDTEYPSYEEIPIEISSLIETRYKNKRVIYILGPEIYPEDRGELETFLEDRPFLTTTSMTGYIPQDLDGYLGFIEKDFQVYPPAKDIIKQVDIALLIGLDHRSPEVNQLKRINPSIQVDTIQRSWIYRVDDIWGDIHEDWTVKKHINGYAFRGDILKFIRLLSTIDTQDIDVDGPKLREARLKLVLETISKEDSRYVHQGRLAHTISLTDIDGYIITCDTGGNEQWIREFIAPHKRVRYLYSGGFGAIGYSLPASIGAYMGMKEVGYEGVLSIVGDGSLMMSIQELKTMVEYNINVKIIVFNDSTYGILEMLSVRDIGSRIDGRIGVVNFSKIAEGMGMESLRIDREEDIETAIQDMLKSRGPFLIDVVSSPEEIPTLLRR